MESPRNIILLVEDTEDIRYLIKMMLEIKGYRVVEAANGQQAIDRALEEHPDLIFMDLNMPILNGFEATRRLRSNPATEKIPVVGLSAHCRDGWRDEALEAGCNDCIQKPVDDDALEKVLAQFLRS